MSKEILGIHHVTAIAGDPQTNLNFYAGTLGLRLVKLTVNFDDPGTYHLYYGDGIGHPGTILTFFPWPHAPKGRHGTGQVTQTSFAVPASALGFWIDRLTGHNIAFTKLPDRFGEKGIAFSDPDGLTIELIFTSNVNAEHAYQAGPIPVESAIHGFHSATLTENDHARTADLLAGTLGFRLAGQEGNRFRYAAGTGEAGAMIDVLSEPKQSRGSVLVGTVHHIAFRTRDDAQQLEWLEELAKQGHHTSPVMDREYFHSIYFREPGGILFEIATDPPGFAINESVEALGSKLVLPPWLEPRREELVATLPPLRLQV